ncbi:tegument protein/FGARAT [Cricetid gammaherpesvirus 2]|uniref:Tegument protein/FGARAT n=1 Tax=Cricetid gammaherpesvirus 2 TaxID=1605972 RepID=E9M5Q8_9GAMA|nr:tegument protein/FGARAT [Cricetid gammaherpesvirus 2]ADW24416.1 tegument protein/FGARAT [Cricetid gammaherpesvirus 2]ADW24498.1 tegument protein/FGARAT [Cricetid gammaherpesvirus 2]
MDPLSTFILYADHGLTIEERLFQDIVNRGRLDVDVEYLNAIEIICGSIIDEDDGQADPAQHLACYRIVSFALSMNHPDNPFTNVRPITPRRESSITYAYGPDPWARPTTMSKELEAMLTSLFPRFQTRVETYRKLVLRFSRTPRNMNNLHLREHTGNALDALFVDNTTRVTVTPEDLIREETAMIHELVVPEEDTPLDELMLAFMYPREDQTPSISHQCSLGEFRRNSIYPCFLQPIDTMSYSSVISGTPSSRATAVLHSHCRTSAPGHFLEPSHFLLSWQPGCDIIQAMCGMFILRSEIEEPALVTQRPSLQAYLAQARALGATGCPITGGFVRPIMDTSENLGTRCLLHTCTISTTNTENFKAQPRQTGDYIICMGDFVPIMQSDTPTFDHDYSSLEFNKLSATLQQYIEMFAENPISKIIRPMGKATVKQQLMELVHPTGAWIDTGRLPQNTINVLQEVPFEEYERVIHDKFLNLHCNVLLMLVSRSNALQASSDEEAMLDPLTSLITLAAQYKIPLRIIGRTHTKQKLEFLRPHAAEGPGEYSQDRVLFSLDDTPLIATIPIPSHPLRRRPFRYDQAIDWERFDFSHIVQSILRHPAVESKEYITRHIDRTCNGLVAQHCGCGPCDLPLSDYSITCSHTSKVSEPVDSIRRSSERTLLVNWWDIRDLINSPDTWFSKYSDLPSNKFPCIVSSIGEQSYKMQIDSTRGVSYALAEALLSIAICRHVTDWSQLHVTGSICWDPSPPNRMELFHTMMACKDMCNTMGTSLTFTSIMSSNTTPEYLQEESASPINTITLTAQCPGMITNAPKMTPDLKEAGNYLVWISASPKLTIAGSIFQQVTGVKASKLIKLDPEVLGKLCEELRYLCSQDWVVSAHDISDGGLIGCVMEMCMAGVKGCSLYLPRHTADEKLMLLSETPGVVLEIEQKGMLQTMKRLKERNLFHHALGTVKGTGHQAVIQINFRGQPKFTTTVGHAMSAWRGRFIEETAMACSHLPPNEQMTVFDYGDNNHYIGGLSPANFQRYLKAFACRDGRSCTKVCVCILPGQPKPYGLMGVLKSAGFEPVACNLLALEEEDLLRCCGLIFTGKSGTLHNMTGAAIAAQTIIRDASKINKIAAFYSRPGTFMLGFGEFGTEILSSLGIINIHGPDDIRNIAERDPFDHVTCQPNASGKFECLWLNIRLPESKSIFLHPIQNSIIPAWVAGNNLGLHWSRDGQQQHCEAETLISARFHEAEPHESLGATHYPRNPSGVYNAAGLCSPDGRMTSLLFDPSHSAYPWQWPHQPSPMMSTPWQLCFARLFLWSIFEQHRVA